jgi:hypothetical protein
MCKIEPNTNIIYSIHINVTYIYIYTHTHTHIYIYMYIFPIVELLETGEEGKKKRMIENK